MSNTKKMAIIAFLSAMFFVGITALAEATPADGPTDASVEILRVESDSVLMRLRWTAAPGATFYRMQVGDDAGTWTRQADTEQLTGVVWAMMVGEEQSAFACAIAFNRHPVRGEQEGGRLCRQFTIPADLAPPGQPGNLEVFPDTTEIRIVALSPDGLNLTLRSLGENAVDLSYAYRSAGVQYTCVRFPDGSEGLVESETVDGWIQRTVPNPRTWEMPGCWPDASSNAPDLITLHWQPSQPVLSMWPGETQMTLIEDRIIFFAHRNSVLPSGLSSAE